MVASFICIWGKSDSGWSTWTKGLRAAIVLAAYWESSFQLAAYTGILYKLRTAWFCPFSTTSFQQGKESEIISPPFCLSRCILLFLKPVSPPSCPWCSFKICFDLWRRLTRGRKKSVLSDCFPTLLFPTALGCTCHTYNSLTPGITVSVRFSLWIKLV